LGGGDLLYFQDCWPQGGRTTRRCSLASFNLGVGDASESVNFPGDRFTPSPSQMIQWLRAFRPGPFRPHRARHLDFRSQSGLSGLARAARFEGSGLVDVQWRRPAHPRLRPDDAHPVGEGGMRSRSSCARCSPTHVVGMTPPVESMTVVSKIFSNMKIPSAWWRRARWR